MFFLESNYISTDSSKSVSVEVPGKTHNLCRGNRITGITTIPETTDYVLTFIELRT